MDNDGVELEAVADSDAADVACVGAASVEDGPDELPDAGEGVADDSTPELSADAVTLETTPDGTTPLETVIVEALALNWVTTTVSFLTFVTVEGGGVTTLVTVVVVVNGSGGTDGTASGFCPGWTVLTFEALTKASLPEYMMPVLSRLRSARAETKRDRPTLGVRSPSANRMNSMPGVVASIIWTGATFEPRVAAMV